MTNSETVKLRKFPYPYQSALSISSDIDLTDNVDNFIEMQRFLNTKESTKTGEGLGLEIGNSFLMYDTENTLSYYNGGSKYIEAIKKLIQAGYVDTLHSYGDKATRRDDAINSINDLDRSGCKVDVWIDHALAPSNFGKYRHQGKGDIPASEIYHSDLTLKYGIKFIWTGQVSRIIGQDTRLKLSSILLIWNPVSPIKSMITMFREASKLLFSLFGNDRYSMHLKNKLIQLRKLADGNKVYEFLRFNNHFDGRADVSSLAYNIQPRFLNYLKKINGYKIIYTHLGKNNANGKLFPNSTVKALRNLEEEYRDGNIYVTTTSKLLNYYIKNRFLKWSFLSDNGTTTINIDGIDDPIDGFYVPDEKELAGITFCIPKDSNARVFLDGKEIKDTLKNPPDYKGESSIMFPLQPLLFPQNL